MKGYLWANGIAWKDYAQHVDEISARVKQASVEAMQACDRPVQYLSSGKESKEKMARAIAQRDGITSGPVCGFTAVEPCFSWRIQGNPETQKLELKCSLRQCLYVYHYWIDAALGFMSARLQTWGSRSPFTFT